VELSSVHDDQGLLKGRISEGHWRDGDAKHQKAQQHGGDFLHYAISYARFKLRGRNFEVGTGPVGANKPVLEQLHWPDDVQFSNHRPKALSYRLGKSFVMNEI
jgi:hypothetical protein